MFEMFALLINFNHLWRNGYLLLAFFLSSCVKLSCRKYYSAPSSTLYIREFALGICHENLPWLFTARIGRSTLPWQFAAGICHGYSPREFSSGICCGNLVQKFAVAICRENLMQEFAVAISSGFFAFARKYFFVYVSKSCLYGSKPFLYVMLRKLFYLWDFLY